MWPKRRKPHLEPPVDDTTTEDSADLNEEIKQGVARLRSHSEALATEVARLQRLVQTPAPRQQRRPHGNDHL